MSKESIYSAMEAQEFLPGSMRWRVGSLNEHADQTDRIRYVTPDGRSYVVEYHTHVERESKKTFSDVFDIIEIDPANQVLKG